MSSMASYITSLMIAYSTVYSGGDQRKHRSSASLAFVRGIHQWPVNFPHKGPVTRKMTSSWMQAYAAVWATQSVSGNKSNVQDLPSRYLFSQIKTYESKSFIAKFHQTQRNKSCMFNSITGLLKAMMILVLFHSEFTNLEKETYSYWRKYDLFYGLKSVVIIKNSILYHWCYYYTSFEPGP